MIVAFFVRYYGPLLNHSDDILLDICCSCTVNMVTYFHLAGACIFSVRPLHRGKRDKWIRSGSRCSRGTPRCSAGEWAGYPDFLGVVVSEGGIAM